MNTPQSSLRPTYMFILTCLCLHEAKKAQKDKQNKLYPMSLKCLFRIGIKNIF